MDTAAYLDRRVVLKCRNNLSYAGSFRDVLTLEGRGPAARVELDEESGFSVLCPLDFVEKITVVPIHKD